MLLERGLVWIKQGYLRLFEYNQRAEAPSRILVVVCNATNPRGNMRDMSTSITVVPLKRPIGRVLADQETPSQSEAWHGAWCSGDGETNT